MHCPFEVYTQIFNDVWVGELWEPWRNTQLSPFNGSPLWILRCVEDHYLVVEAILFSSSTFIQTVWCLLLELLVFNWIHSSQYQWNVPCGTGCNTGPKHDRSTPMFNSWRGVLFMKFCCVFSSNVPFALCSQKGLFKLHQFTGLVSKMHQACLLFLYKFLTLNFVVQTRSLVSRLTCQLGKQLPVLLL